MNGMLIYIHGFNSSAQSFKARLLRERTVALGRAAEFRCPELDHRPSRAIEQLDEVIEHADAPVCLVGSSLGGYYATDLAEKHAVRAALVNPAVRPYDLLAAYIGPQRNLYTSAGYEFPAEHLGALRALDVPVTPGRYLLLVATGDEVLDYRMATSKYQGCEQIVVRGGDHGFAGFENYVAPVLRYCRVIR